METSSTKVWGTYPTSIAIDIDGYHCAIIKHPDGYLCGYVTLPEHHPWHGKTYEYFSDKEIDVHGGITFYKVIDKLLYGLDIFDKGQYAIGFDCSHCDDFVPSRPDRGGAYRDVDFVHKELEKLVEQCKKTEFDLNPCPFCGASIESTLDLKREYFFVHCRSCGIHTDFTKGRNEVIRLWNRRTS